MFPYLNPDHRVGFFIGWSPLPKNPLIDPFPGEQVSCFDIDESGKMVQKRRRKRRTVAQRILDIGLAGIGLMFMGVVRLLVAFGHQAVRAVRFVFKKLQSMRSPPAALHSNSGKTSKTNAVKAPRRPQTVATSVSTTPRPLQPRAPAVSPSTGISGPGRWIPVNKPIVVHGITIAGGLFYVGSSLRTATGQDDPCLIDPDQPIAFRSMPVKIDGYWPSYGAINPQARRTYLEWLSSGRKDPNIDIGYVFLYFYGLERRAIFDAALDSALMRDYPILAAELTRLLSIYGNRSASFKKYARQLLDWVTFTNEQKLYASTNLAKIEDSLMKIKFALGQASMDSAPIPAKLVLAWVKQDRSNFALRTPATRCGAQFDAVFETKYREKFGSGIVFAPNKTRLKFIYSPASSGFSNAADIAMSFKDIPDTTVTGKMANAVKAIVEDATQTIEPFSRYLSRNADGVHDLEGLILLPPYLWPTALRQTLHGFKRAVLKAPVTMTCMELMNALGADTTLNKEKSKALAQSLSALSIGMEPDVLITQKAPRPDDTIVLFDLATVPDPTRDTTSYKACLLTVQLASAVAASDGEFSKDEFVHLNKQLQFWAHLPANHRARLSAQLRIRRVSPIKLHVIAKQMQTLSQDAKNAVIAFMATLVQSDGQVSAKEVRFMEKVHTALGLDASAYLAQHEAVLLQEKLQKKTLPKAATTAPVKPAFVLDPLKIAALQSETSTVDALLQGIFAPQTEELTPSISPVTVATVVPAVDTTIAPSKPSIVQLDAAKIAALQEDTERVGSLLAGIFVDDTAVPDSTEPEQKTQEPQDTTASESNTEPADQPLLLPGLDEAHDAFARLLVTRTQWSREELQDVANDMELMLDGALERVNDAAYDAHDAPLTEGEDPIEINLETKDKLLS